MIRIAALALSVLVAAPAAFAQVAVKGDWVTLGDVAPVTGDAAKVLVGPAPPAGETLAMDPAFLVSVAKKHGVILAIPLDHPIMVTRGTIPQAAVPPAPQVARAAPQARQAQQPPMVVSQEPPPGWILVLARDLPRGGIIREDDLRWAEPEAGRGSRMPVELDGAVGMEAKRALKAGLALQIADLKEPSLVKKGQPVTLVYAAPGLKLTASGLAQSDAAMGQSVRVLNSFTKRTIEAVATAEGEVQVSRR